MVVDAEIKALLSFQILAEMRINLAPMELRSRLDIGKYTNLEKKSEYLIKCILKGIYTLHISVPTPIVCASVR